MWSVRWAAGCAALLLASLVLGEPHHSFHPPVYHYEFGDRSDHTVHFATVGHIGPHQRFAKVNLKPLPCVRRERYVRVVVLNARNPAHVTVRQHAVYIYYTRGEHTPSTYIVWANRNGVQDPDCLRRRLHAQDIQSSHRRQLVQYQNQLHKPRTLHQRHGYPLQQSALHQSHYYPGHVVSRHHGGGGHQHWNYRDHSRSELEGRDGVASGNSIADQSLEDSMSDDSCDSIPDGGDERNIEVINEEHGELENEAKYEPIWKLKRQSKHRLNKPMESTSPINNVEVQDIEDPYNMTGSVRFGLNTNIFRRTSPVKTVKEDIVEEYVTPEKFMSRSTLPSGVSMIPGFTYQFFNLPSSSEATAVNLPPSDDLPTDQTEWDAYFKNLINNKSSMIATDVPMLANVAPPTVPK